MEFLTGVKQKEVLEIGDLLLPEMVGREVKVNGAVHAIRDMGTIAFVVLRKREGLVQCVYEEGKTEFDLKDLKEEDKNIFIREIKQRKMISNIKIRNLKQFFKRIILGWNIKLYLKLK